MRSATSILVIVMAISFPTEGKESLEAVWHWKAFRTNPQGYATDKTHHYTLSKPGGTAKSHAAANDEEIWIARP